MSVPGSLVRGKRLYINEETFSSELCVTALRMTIPRKLLMSAVESPKGFWTHTACKLHEFTFELSADWQLSGVGSKHSILKASNFTTVLMKPKEHKSIFFF